MADIIGFNNKEKKVHCFQNSLDGRLDLHLYVDCAVGLTEVYVNSIRYTVKDAGEGAKPFDCGVLSLPRGEITLSVTSGCEISEILLTERDDIDTPEFFLLIYENRKDQFVFERRQPEYTQDMIDNLKRHGFLYEEIGDCAVGKMPSGIPLGGMGCGKLEICEDGMFTAFTGNNNQDSPIYRMPGSFMAFGSKDSVRILRQDPMSLPYTPAEQVTSDFVFPFAKLQVSDVSVPAEVEIEAFSPNIPGNVADSAIPCAVFHVTMRNTSSFDTDVFFCFSWENIINVGGSMEVPNGGERIFPTCYHTWNGSFVWSDRRVNTCEKIYINNSHPALLFSATDDRKNPMSFGEHLLWCSDEETVCICNRSILPEDEQAFSEWLKHGEGFCNAETDTEFKAGAMVVRKQLGMGEACEFDFVLAWYMPILIDESGANSGVEYTNRYCNVTDVLDYVLREKDRLYRQTKELETILYQSTLPEWFVRRLLDDRFVTVTDSWYDRDGNFSINEAPTGMGGCLGTLDQRTASQGFYTTFYPELDKRELDLFRRSQADDGMCAHELGFASMTLKCRPFSKWPDLAASYVIQVYHTYQRTGDTEFLKKHMPHIKKAVEWTISLDDKHCGIPYICQGRGTTYDNQFWEGINAFIATMQIALYRIGALCARVAGDKQDADKWDALAEVASQTRETYLWNESGSYYNNAYNFETGDMDTSCFICSMAGEWAALRAGLEPVISRERIAAVTSSIAAHCVGPNGLSDQGGRRDTTQGFTQYPMAYLASAALYADDSASAWKTAETTERVITGSHSNHFNQALTYSYSGERYGLPYYMTAPSSWNMLEALVGLSADLPRGEMTLALHKAEGIKCAVPIFLTYAWFWAEMPADGSTLTLKPIKSIGDCHFRTLKIHGRWRVADTEVKEIGDYTVINKSFDPGKMSLHLTEK